MTTDREVATRVKDLQSRARDYGLVELPGYAEWSARKLDERESEALIANLDARAMWLLPEEAAEIEDADFDEMLNDLKRSLGEG